MSARPHRFIVPEVVQTSAMDCGPASLKALLEGFRVHVSYGRLREACQTDVDGTSIDTLEDIAVQLGLDAEQVMVPLEHVLMDEAENLPALVVIRHPDGQTHFVVVWSRVGPLVQVMDPGVGRCWIPVRSFLDSVYVHHMMVPAEVWREFAGSDPFLDPLGLRLRALGLAGAEAQEILARASADPGWRGVAEVDAAARLTDALIRAGGVRRGAEAGQLIRGLLARAAGSSDPTEVIPAPYWSVSTVRKPAPDPSNLWMAGAVLVRVRGPRPAEGPEGPARPPLSPDLAAALNERPERAGRTLLTLLRADGPVTPAVVLGAALVSALATLIEALLFRGLFDAAVALSLPMARLGALVAVLVFCGAALLVDWALQSGALRMGRLLELRMRVAFQHKVPRLGDRYLQSRPTSDMAERSHSAHVIRGVPGLGVGFLRSTFGLVFTTAGIGWLDPTLLPMAVLAAVISVALPLLTGPLLSERDMRFRTHLGALSRFYLDALLGLTAVRTHGAEPAVRGQHEALLSAWTRAGLQLQSAAVALEGASALVGFGLAAALLAMHLSAHGGGGAVLLLAWWALSLPAHGQGVAQMVRQYPAVRNTALRLLEPLRAPEDVDGDQPVSAAAPGAEGMAIALDGVTVRASGHTILEGLDLRLAPGEHVGVVGPSGAGKSSLLGLLLGWHRASEGEVRVDGALNRGEALARLRRQCAWVDPSVQLWNRSFLDNLMYGAEPRDLDGLSAAMGVADLMDVLERLPEGLQTPLGEGGGLLSGGQGQRVRLGRAALRRDARLVLLDEPFRGLDRERRRALLASAREWWPRATLVVVTHDVGDTFDLPRVLVVDGGRVVEDAPPGELAARPDSRYRALLDAEARVREQLWGGPEWRRLRLADGALRESGAEGAP